MPETTCKSLGVQLGCATATKRCVCARCCPEATSQKGQQTGLSEFHYTQTATSRVEPVLDSKSVLIQPFCDVPLHNNGPEICFTFGKYRSPQEFPRGAKLLQHPFDKTCALPDSMLCALALTLRTANLLHGIQLPLCLVCCCTHPLRCPMESMAHTRCAKRSPFVRWMKRYALL